MVVKPVTQFAVSCPKQQNHLCLASLELVVRSRHGTRVKSGAPERRTFRVGRVVRETEALSLTRLGGYFPQPHMDPISAACLSFEDPHQNRPITFIILVDQVIPGDHRAAMRFLAGGSGKTANIALMCDNEMELVNWVAYLVQW